MTQDKVTSIVLLVIVVVIVLIIIGLVAVWLLMSLATTRMVL